MPDAADAPPAADQPSPPDAADARPEADALAPPDVTGDVLAPVDAADAASAGDAPDVADAAPMLDAHDAPDVAPAFDAPDVADVTAPDAPACAPGFASCDGDPANGCETDTQTSPSHCGACGRSCPAVLRAVPTCAAGACDFRCAPGYGDCNGNAADGCEVALSTAAHCGACGAACARANATATCATGACAIAACVAGFGDCDGVGANGCEAPLTTRSHCGACGAACAAGAECVAGSCVALAPPRLRAPLSTATVTSRRPILRWVPAPGADGARVQLCRDRACADVIATLDADGASAAPTADLPTGVVFWRAFGRAGAALSPTPSATWQMVVGARSAPVNASGGTTLDVNGDGHADVAVGAYCAPGTPSSCGPGRAYVYLGDGSGTARTPSTTLAGMDGALGQFGGSLASAGDVNGDGYGDLVVGASRATVAGVFGTGRVYVYLGGRSGIAATPSNTLTGRDGENGFFGIVESAGDVNGDGYADLIVGAFTAGPYAGRAYVYLGGASGVASAPAVTLTGTGETDRRFGASVASAGDVNGDGYADVVVGEPGGGTYAGRAYLYLGSASGISATPARVFVGPDGGVDGLGWAVRSAGDVNGDGYADLIVGAPRVNIYSGRAYVYLGSATGIGAAPTTSLVGPDGYGAYFGASLSSAGDVNGDGYGDVIIGAYLAEPVQTGRAHVYLGGPSGLATTAAINFVGPNGTSSGFGSGVAGAGDLNRDGRADLIIGAYLESSRAGRAYLYLGTAGGIGGVPTLTLDAPDGPEGVFGVSVARSMRLPVVPRRIRVGSSC